MNNWTKWWSDRFAIGCWWIWKWQNEVTFNGSGLDVFLKIDLLNKTVTKMIDAISRMKLMRMGPEGDSDIVRRW